MIRALLLRNACYTLAEYNLSTLVHRAGMCLGSYTKCGRRGPAIHGARVFSCRRRCCCATLQHSRLQSVQWNDQPTPIVAVVAVTIMATTIANRVLEGGLLSARRARRQRPCLNPGTKPFVCLYTNLLCRWVRGASHQLEDALKGGNRIDALADVAWHRTRAQRGPHPLERSELCVQRVHILRPLVSALVLPCAPPARLLGRARKQARRLPTVQSEVDGAVDRSLKRGLQVCHVSRGEPAGRADHDVVRDEYRGCKPHRDVAHAILSEEAARFGLLVALLQLSHLNALHVPVQHPVG